MILFYFFYFKCDKKINKTVRNVLFIRHWFVFDSSMLALGTG